MKQRVMVYPFDREFLPILRLGIHPNTLEFSELVSPAGWGLEGMDAGAIDYGSPVGLQISSDFEASLDNCDTVFFTKSDTVLNRDISLAKLNIAIEHTKNIICTLDLSKEEYESFHKQCQKRSVAFEYYNNNLKSVDISHYDDEVVENSYREFAVPIIAVAGIVENVNKFQTQLELYQWLRELGYKVSLITSRSYGDFVGAHSFPSFMYDRGLVEHERIILFNNFVKNIELQESPDLIIVGIPGGMVPLRRNKHNRFGIMAFETTRAVPPDVGLICSYFENYNEKYISEFTEMCRYRFSMELAAMVADNLVIEFHGQGLPESVSYMRVPYQAVTDRYKNASFSLPVYGPEDKEKAFENLIQTLSNFSDFETY